MSLAKCINLNVGEIAVGESPLVISTVLGSCVAVCLFSPSRKTGGMIHFALPDRSFAKSSDRNNLNFGDIAIKELVAKLKATDLKAKICGGASVTQDLFGKEIGRENIRKARETLAELGIQIVGEDVSGTSGRKVFFYTDTGRLRISVSQETKAPARKIKVLIVDDSKPIRDILSKIFECSEIEIAGTASNAAEALPLIKSLRPDVITLDIHMPGKDGVTFLKEYLPGNSIPTVMISSISMNESDLVLNALEYGAVDYIEKPSLGELASKKTFFIEKILTASRIKVRTNHATNAVRSRNQFKHTQDIIAIGASTGGTEALKDVLIRLPENIPPIVIVQHIPPVFSTAFAKRLNDLCPFTVKEAQDGDPVVPGCVLIAPGGKQMEVVKKNNTLVARVFEGEPVNRHKPSVDVLFNSVCKIAGKFSVGVILTGMGNDGAKGLLNLKNSGVHTIAQDEASSVVFGMPKAAIELGAANVVSSLYDVPEAITKFINKSRAA